MARQPSDLERTVLYYLRVLAPELPLPRCHENGGEITPIKGRRFHFDFAWPDEKIAIEAQGGIFMGKSGHTGGKNMEDDYEKNNLCVADGWRVFYVTTGILKRNPDAFIEQLKKAFND